jgi:hypothetical protein
MAGLRPLAPVYTAPLLRPLLGELLGVLRGLTADQWEAPTVAGAWRVRDVAAHLLDGDLRKLAAGRDGHLLPMETPIRSDRDLARFINALNAEGVAWARRLSPTLLVDLLATTGAWAADLLEALPPHDAAMWPVSWAGGRVSENWMDVGREYTERWHHQMQIRDAVAAPPTLLETRWCRPLLDVSVRALPRSYADVMAAPGTAVTFAVATSDAAADRSGDLLGAWTLVRDAERWTLHEGIDAGAATVVRATADAAWRLLYNAPPSSVSPTAITIDGDRRLAEPLLQTRSIVI